MAGPGKHPTNQSRVDSSSLTPISPQQSGSIQVGTSSSASPLPHESNLHTSAESTPKLEINVVSNIDSSILKRKRGPTRNIAFAKKKQVGKKLVIDISEDENRIVGSDSDSFIIEGGCIIRKQASLKVPKWSKISEEDREIMRRMVSDSFEIRGNLDAAKVIDAQLNRQYRNYRYKLHIEHFKIHPTSEEALLYPPKGMTRDNWEYLCKYFASPQFKEISDRNTKNRAKLKTPHTARTKSFAQLRQEKKSKTGNEVGPIYLYEITRFSNKKGSWVTEETGQNLEKMKQLYSESQVEGANHVTEEEICAQVLGEKSSYVRGRGASVKPSLSAYNQLYKVELDELRRRAEQAEKENSEIKKQNSEIKEQNTFMQAEMQEMKIMLKKMMEHIGGNMSPPS